MFIGTKKFVYTGPETVPEALTVNSYWESPELDFRIKLPVQVADWMVASSGAGGGVGVGGAVTTSVAFAVLALASVADTTYEPPLRGLARKNAIVKAPLESLTAIATGAPPNATVTWLFAVNP